MEGASHSYYLTWVCLANEAKYVRAAHVAQRSKRSELSLTPLRYVRGSDAPTSRVRMLRPVLPHGGVSSGPVSVPPVAGRGAGVTGGTGAEGSGMGAGAGASGGSFVVGVTRTVGKGAGGIG